MTFTDTLKNKFQLFYANLLARSLALSLLAHLLILITYGILIRQDTTSSYEFGSETSFSGTTQAVKSSQRKLTVTEKKKAEKKIVPEKSETGEMAPQEAASEPGSENNGDEEDIANAVDLSFMPNATAPHLMGSLKQYYPELAREMNIEATVYIAIVINRKGKVIKVKVNTVVLSKKLPSATENLLKTKFAESIRKSLAEVRFSAPMINGNNVPIEMEQMVKYKLNE